MNAIIKNIPNSITCLNLISGCVAILFAFSPYADFGALQGWQCAAIAIICAAVFDFLDGFAARLLGAYSELGKQLDSLCDLVSFGVAPAMILLNMLSESPESLTAPWAIWLALLIPVGAALRLAKFNIDTRQTSSFIGLPVPANALFWLGYCSLISVVDTAAATWSVAPLIIIVSWLMVSPLPMFSLKFKSFGWKGNERRWILIAASAILLACFGWAALSLIILLYIILSFLSKKP